MFKVILFAGIALFWVSISVVLVQTQLATSSARQFRVSARRSAPLMRSVAIVRLSTAPAVGSAAGR